MAHFVLGQKTPDFVLPSVSGENFSFDEAKHKYEDWHLIIFFRGAWCPVCVSELKEWEENKSYFEGKKVNLITISTDELGNLKEMKEEHDFTFPILSDDGLEVLKDYDVYYHSDDAPYEDHGVHGEPAYFLIDQNGNLLYQQRQTSPFGRPGITEIRKIVQYISKNLKS